MMIRPRPTPTVRAHLSRRRWPCGTSISSRTAITTSDNLLLSRNQQQTECGKKQMPPTPSAQQLQCSLLSPSAASTGMAAVSYVNAPHGLFLIRLSKTAKTSQISRKFLGRFMKRLKWTVECW